jgi:hypothetical protein
MAAKRIRRQKTEIQLQTWLPEPVNEGLDLFCDQNGFSRAGLTRKFAELVNLQPDTVLQLIEGVNRDQQTA